jgi:hypothetical protein
LRRPPVSTESLETFVQHGGLAEADRGTSFGSGENALYGNTMTDNQQAVTMLSGKNAKAKPNAPSIEGKDAEEIVAGIQAMYDKLPAFIRPMLPAMPDILRRIPASAGKYTLSEIIELLDWAYETGKLKR